MESKSVKFTKQLALYFVALVMLLFMVTTIQSSRTYTQRPEVGVVNGVYTEATDVSQKLMCDTCLTGGSKMLCFSRTEKEAFCANSLPGQQRGGLQCVLCNATR